MHPYIICAVLAAAAVFLAAKCFSMKRSAREIREKMSEKLSGDTNTLIDISSADGDMRELAAALNDELVRLREERRLCRQGDTELKDAVTNVSHDLRTPLTAMCGYLDLLGREEMSAEARQYLERIVDRAEVMKQLTEELFRYSVVAAAKEFKLERLCVNDVLEESLAAFYGAVSQRGITPEIDITERRLERITDRSALTRVFGNILTNALKYSSGDLYVKMTEDCVITFANSSDDLEKISAERLFDRFYTVETGSNSTGLGLSIAKLLVEQMNGGISSEIRDDKLVITVKL
ncbi:MAG: HAMP domain-containing histidine kinase [Lachnospiraceae bacterium]|nr:HAMP domain-containing histidine kinase [Ruminococcus sp.]MCM1273961.1 HAMP domain-containing histidine kinase [Lachnospiraceae bacterium]